MKQLILLVCFLFIFSFRLFAHPHIFIDSYVTFVFERDMLKGMRISWVWDEMWSQQVVMDCDKNLDDEFNSGELAIVEEEYFSGIKDYDYFMKIMIDGKPHAVPAPVNFNAKIAPATQIVTYDFFVLLNVAVSAGKSIKVVFDDETIYTAFSIKQGMLKIKGGDIVTNEMSVERYKYYGCVMSFNIESK